MRNTARRQGVIFVLDLLLVLTIFYFCRYMEGYPRWYWLLASALVWTAIGMGSRKLKFEYFRLASVAVASILSINLLTFALIVLVWQRVFPERCSGVLHWHPLVLISIAELFLYYAFRRLVLKKIPFAFEDVVQDATCEPTVTGKICFDSIKDSDRIVVAERFNDIRYLNTFLADANRNLSDGGCIVLHGQTSGARKEMIFRDNPSGLNHVIYVVDYIWSRVFPKLTLTRGLYRSVTQGRNRNFPRVEILGRLCRAGFKIIGEEMREGVYFVAAVKSSDPATGEKPHYGLMVRLRRIGYQGETIGVLKFRTMYAYSEYLQAYTYETQGLEKGGKFRSDFRVNIWGRFLRSAWLDELPMLYNWIAGDLKLVGVRPLSSHYFGLYTPEMQQLRTSVMPGLIPPFYYEAHDPETLEEIQESERKYIESYLQAPFKTDCRYLFGILGNILFRHRRSK